MKARLPVFSRLVGNYINVQCPILLIMQEDLARSYCNDGDTTYIQSQKGQPHVVEQQFRGYVAHMS